MVVLRVKKDWFKYKLFGGFFLVLLLKFKYGLVCVVNIDVRGDVFINVFFKRFSENSKFFMFDFVFILGYVGGEF